MTKHRSASRTLAKRKKIRAKKATTIYEYKTKTTRFDRVNRFEWIADDAVDFAFHFVHLQTAIFEEQLPIAIVDARERKAQLQTEKIVLNRAKCKKPFGWLLAIQPIALFFAHLLVADATNLVENRRRVVVGGHRKKRRFVVEKRRRFARCGRRSLGDFGG